LDTLLPVDEEAEKKARAEQARKMANGAPAHQQPTGPPPQPIGVQRQAVEALTDEEGDEEDTEGDDSDDGEEEEGEEEEVVTEVDEDESVRTGSHDLLSSDY